MTEIRTVGSYAGSGILGLMAKGVKNGDGDAVKDAARLLSEIIPAGSTIAPMPSHYGRATYMLEVALEMQKYGFTVEDCLASTAHESLFVTKRRGYAPDVEMTLLYRRHGDAPLYVIDNVISTGRTMMAAAKAGAERFAFIAGV